MYHLIQQKNVIREIFYWFFLKQFASDYGKGAEYKVNIQKSTAFLYTNNKTKIDQQ